jgi:hypothetical protein
MPPTEVRQLRFEQEWARGQVRWMSAEPVLVEPGADGLVAAAERGARSRRPPTAAI